MISKYYNTEFVNSRMVWTGESSAIDDNNIFMGHLQQSSLEVSENMGLSFSKAFTIWCDLKTDVKEGDQLADGFHTYKVRGIKDLSVGRNKHKQVYVEKEEEYG